MRMREYAAELRHLVLAKSFKGMPLHLLELPKSAEEMALPGREDSGSI